MAFVRLFKDLLRDKEFGQRIVPIIPDEARTFGMDSFFPSLKIYNRNGQHYTSVDGELMLAYKESQIGQILHEGINEAGSLASFTAVGTSYATHGEPMIPIYIFYSMFGFQRTGDGFWAAADQMARGFVLGATAGRTTLTGEGLQHADGHSQLLAATNPAVVAYDPAYAYEIAHIVENGLRRMYGERPGERLLLPHPLQRAVRAAGRAGELDVEGCCAASTATAPRTGEAARTSRSSWRPASACPGRCARRELLADDWDVAADVWSVTSWTELRRDGVAIEKERLLHPERPAGTPYVTRRWPTRPARSSRCRTACAAVPDQIRPWVPGNYITLGTDGFGFSDTRPAARRHFNIDAESVVVAVLEALARDGDIDPSVAVEAPSKYKIDDVMAAPTSRRRTRAVA